METKYLNETNDSVEYIFPELELLDDYSEEKHEVSDEEVRRNSDEIRTILSQHKLEAAKIEVVQGPMLTQYKLLSGKIGVRKAKSVAENLYSDFSDWRIRVTAEKGMISMEIPNKNPSKISLKDILGSNDFQNTSYELPVAIGTNIAGKAKVINLADAKHIHVGGATGQDKTVFLNTVITSLLYAKRPDELKFVFIAPKNKYSIYSGLSKSYLVELQSDEKQDGVLNPIIDDSTQAEVVLQSLCKEMENRYMLMKEAFISDIKSYNKSHRLLPYIVVIIDEYADLVYSKSCMASITDLIQKGHVVGIHMIIATKRPTSFVTTKLIRTCFPTKIAFRVGTVVDSNDIIGAPGAEKLMGKGDMFYQSGFDTERVQGAYVDVFEIIRVVNSILSKKCDYNYKLILKARTYKRDPMFDEAVKLISKRHFCTPATLQKGLAVGYYRACRILVQMEDAGIVGTVTNTGRRPVLTKLPS